MSMRVARSHTAHYNKQVHAESTQQGEKASEAKKRTLKKIKSVIESEVPSSPMPACRAEQRSSDMPFKMRKILPFDLAEKEQNTEPKSISSEEQKSEQSTASSVSDTAPKVNRQYKEIQSSTHSFTSIYSGDVDPFNRYDGKGTFETSLGSKMEGEWKEGRFINGVISRNGKVTYKGEYKDGFHGKGVLYLTGGTVLDGTFKNKEFISGTRTDRNGTIHKGNFKNYELDGIGRKRLPDGSKQKGTFRNGKLIDAPSFVTNKRYTLKDESSIILESLDGNLAKGTALFPNGDRYEGQFILIGKLRIEIHGHGKYTSKRGRFVEAEFENGYKILGDYLVAPSAWKSDLK